MCVAIIATSLGALSAPAGADDVWGFGPRPVGDGPARDYFIYEIEPGSTVSDYVRLSNFTDRDLTFRIYARDASVAQDGVGFQVQEYEEEPVDSGGWYQLPPDADLYTLPAQTTADIPFTFAVPTSASPGDHASALVAELIDDIDAQTGGVDVNTRIAARMYTRVSGDLQPAMIVSSIDLDYDDGLLNTGGQAVVTYSISNVGNVRLSPKISVVLTDVFGRTVAEAETRSFQDVLPNGTVTVTEIFGDISPWLKLTAKVDAEVTGATPVSASASTSQWIMPWLLVILAVVIVVGLLVFRWWRRRRRA